MSAAGPPPAGDGAAGGDDDKYDIIPASRRPDGTWRKEIKVKKGYVPQDEQKKFETKGTMVRDEREMNKKLGLVPGMDPNDAPGLKPKPKSKTQKKNEKKKVAAAEDSDEDDQPAASLAPVQQNIAKTSEQAAGDANTGDPKEAVNKKIRNLKKKVREIVELEAKDPGALQPEQREKISKRIDLEAGIALLEKQLAAI